MLRVLLPASRIQEGSVNAIPDTMELLTRLSDVELSIFST